MAETPQFAPGDVVVHAVRPEWGDGIVDRAASIKHEGQPAQRLVVKFTHKGRITLNTAMAPLKRKGESPAMTNTASKPTPQDKPNGNGHDHPETDTGEQTTEDSNFELNASSTSSPTSSPPSSKDAGPTMRNDTNTLDRKRNNTNGGGWLASLEAKKTGNGNGKHNGEELRRLPDALSDPFLTLEQRVEAALDTFRFSLEARALIDWAIGQTGLNDPMSRYTRHELEQGFDWFCRDRDLQLKELVREAKSRGRQEMLDGVRRRTKLPAAISALDKARNSA